MAKRKYKRRQTKKSSLDFGVIITIIFSALLTVLIYAESGYVGMALSDFFGGMFGVIKYVLPIGSFAVAIKMACKDDDGYISSKIFQYTLLLIFVAVILSVYEIYNGVINIDQNIADVVRDAYSLGENNIGGGALGTIAAVPLFRLFGRVGTIILSIGVSLILFAVTFGIDISGIVSGWIQTSVDRRRERREERKLAKEEQEDRHTRKIKENRKAYIDIDEDKLHEEQIKINLNGRAIEDEKGRKRFKHEKDDLVPLGMEEKAKMEPDFIEGNLFKQEEEKKEEKVKQVLQLEHA